MTRLLLLTGLLVALVGCTTPISQNPIADALNKPGTIGQVVQRGLLDATWNLDQAVAVGALDKTDPAPACFHGVLGQLGIDPASPAPAEASFTPKVSDLVSAGSVLYIRAQQLKRLQGTGVSAPSSCKELVGQFLIDAAGQGLNAFPGGGALIRLK